MHTYTHSHTCIYAHTQPHTSYALPHTHTQPHTGYALAHTKHPRNHACTEPCRLSKDRCDECTISVVCLQADELLQMARVTQDPAEQRRQLQEALRVSTWAVVVAPHYRFPSLSVLVGVNCIPYQSLAFACYCSHVTSFVME